MQPAPQRGGIVQQAGLFGDIGKRAVAVIAIELVLPKVGAEQVLEAVVVVVAHAHRRRPAQIVQARLFGYVGKRAVAIVLIEAVRRSGGAPSMRVPLRTKMSIQPSLS